MKKKLGKKKIKKVSQDKNVSDCGRKVKINIEYLVKISLFNFSLFKKDFTIREKNR